MDAVDGFEPKEEASDPLWSLNSGSDTAATETQQPAPQKVTSLFKD
jgi:hypothetical protein